jgi:hypothetical protein
LSEEEKLAWFWKNIFHKSRILKSITKKGFRSLSFSLHRRRRRREREILNKMEKETSAKLKPFTRECQGMIMRAKHYTQNVANVTTIAGACHLISTVKVMAKVEIARTR